MILLTNQAEYLPNINFFHRMKYTNKCIIADDIQFSKHSPVNRTKIMTPQGISWLTVPVLTKNKANQLIKDVKIIRESNWKNKHCKTIYHNYKTAPYFEYYEPYLRQMYNKNWTYLIDLNVTFIEIFKGLLKIDTDLILSSTLNIPGKGNEKIINIIKQTGCDRYLTDSCYIDYLDASLFQKHNIKLVYSDFKRSGFTAKDPDNSISDISILHFLFYKGPELGITV